jgi:hypothetical protein
MLMLWCGVACVWRGLAGYVRSLGLTEDGGERSSECWKGEGSSRGGNWGRAFKRPEAIFLAVKYWNRLNPLESFAFNAGILETVFNVHRQAANDFF